MSADESDTAYLLERLDRAARQHKDLVARASRLEAALREIVETAPVTRARTARACGYCWLWMRGEEGPVTHMPDCPVEIARLALEGRR